MAKSDEIPVFGGWNHQIFVGEITSPKTALTDQFPIVVVGQSVNTIFASFYCLNIYIYIYISISIYIYICFNSSFSLLQSPSFSDKIATCARGTAWSRCRARLQRPGRPCHDLGSAADGAAIGRAVLGQAPVPWFRIFGQEPMGIQDAQGIEKKQRRYGTMGLYQQEFRKRFSP